MNNLETALRSSKSSNEYDAAVKTILASKQILAWILNGTTAEYSSMAIEEIIELIENPYVSSILVNPGMTNDGKGDFIDGQNLESEINGERTFKYDVRFKVRSPKPVGKKSFHVVVDLEAQRSYYPGYDLVTRGIFYCGRMLSDQAGRNFTGKNYDALDKVYSIWLCFNCPDDLANTISRYRIDHDPIYGNFKEEARSDMLQVIMVRLSKEEGMPCNKPSKLHSMLYDTFVRDMSAEERIKLLESKYNLKVRDLERSFETMCNLSLGLIEKGYEQGRDELIADMLRREKTPKEISEFCGIPVKHIEEVQATMTLKK